MSFPDGSLPYGYVSSPEATDFHAKLTNFHPPTISPWALAESGESNIADTMANALTSVDMPLSPHYCTKKSGSGKTRACWCAAVAANACSIQLNTQISIDLSPEGQAQVHALRIRQVR